MASISTFDSAYFDQACFGCFSFSEDITLVSTEINGRYKIFTEKLTLNDTITKLVQKQITESITLTDDLDLGFLIKRLIEVNNIEPKIAEVGNINPNISLVDNVVPKINVINVP